MAQRGRGDRTQDRLRMVVEPVVADAELYLEELTVARAGRRHVVRVTVDGDDGIDHDELTEISRALSTALDQAEETAGELPLDSYTLEVSSPGVDRPLTLPRHWRRNVGRVVTVRAGERTVTARIMFVDEAGVTLDPAVQAEPVPFDRLGPGRVQVEFTRLAGDDEDLGTDDPDTDPDAESTDDGDGDDGDGLTEREDRA